MEGTLDTALSFFQRSCGRWRSRRSSHHLLHRRAEPGGSWIEVVELRAEDPRLRAIAALHGQDPAGLVGGFSQLVATQAKTAFIWQASSNTMLSLTAYLQSLGVSAATLSGWNFHEVTGISADGKNIVGNGTLGSDTNLRGFVFAVPAPGAAALATVAGSLLRRRRR